MAKKNSASPSARLHEVGAAEHGQRIDNFLIKHLKSLPRSRLYRIIRKGEVRVNKKRVRPEYKLQTGDRVRIPPVRLEPDENEPIRIPQDLLSRIAAAVLFENENILAVDKPAGLAVHSGSGLRYGLIDVMRQLRPQCEIELVHRLDRDTSGCLLLAKNRPALVDMQRLLQSGEISKFYLAIVKGHWPHAMTAIDLPLRRMAMPNGETKVVVAEQGQPAETRIMAVRHLTRRGIRFSRLLIQLITGRTHQIRVHCQAHDHAIGGDQKYGDRPFNSRMRELGSRRLLLHAARLEIPANAHTTHLILQAPEPEEFTMLSRHER